MSEEYKSNDQELFRELKALEGESGRLTPELVVEAAKASSSNSYLYQHFEWNDSVAGAKYRLIQAYKLIARLRTFRFVNEEGLKRAEELRQGAKKATFIPDDVEENPAVALREYLSTREGKNIFASRDVI